MKDHRYNPISVESAIALPPIIHPPFVELIETLSGDQLSLLMDALEDASITPLDAVFDWASKVRCEMEGREVIKDVWNKGLEALANEADIPY